MQASGCAADLCVFWKIASNGIQQGRSAALVFGACALHRCIAAAYDQGRQHALLHHGRMPVSQPLGLAENWHQFGW